MTARSIIKRGLGSIDAVRQVVCEYYQVTESQLLCRSRPQHLVTPRHVAMYLARELTGLPFRAIADSFHRWDHGTTWYAHRSVAELLTVYPDFLAEIESLKVRIVGLQQQVTTNHCAPAQPSENDCQQNGG